MYLKIIIKAKPDFNGDIYTLKVVSNFTLEEGQLSGRSVLFFSWSAQGKNC